MAGKTRRYGVPIVAEVLDQVALQTSEHERARYRLDHLPGVWRVTGEARLLDREDMLARDYPGPGGEMYFCLRLGGRRSYGPLEAAGSRRLVEFHPEGGGEVKGEPLVVSWLELVERVG